MGACCSQPSQPNDIGPLSDIHSDLDDGVVNGQLALCILQRVRCRDKGDAWRTGTVTSTSPLMVQVDSWDSAPTHLRPHRRPPGRGGCPAPAPRTRAPARGWNSVRIAPRGIPGTRFFVREVLICEAR